MGDSGGHFALAGLAAVEFAGDQTDEFLQGQLTADVAGLAEGRWQWTGYCTPQGKMLCTALIWRCDRQRLGLVMAEDLAEGVIGRLRMYILRARTAGRRMDAAVSGRLAGRQDGQGACRLEDDGWSLALGDGLELQVGGAPAESDAAGEQQWWSRWLQAGAPLIGAAVSERFTPQMASLDLVGGVSFSKGCYVGQEIVARTHHLGKVKRRAYLISGTGAPPSSGSDLLPEKGDQAVGTVIRAAAAGDGFTGIASVRIDAAAGSLKLADERAVAARPPAYGIGDASG